MTTRPKLLSFLEDYRDLCQKYGLTVTPTLDWNDYAEFIHDEREFLDPYLQVSEVDLLALDEMIHALSSNTETT